MLVVLLGMMSGQWVGLAGAHEFEAPAYPAIIYGYTTNSPGFAVGGVVVVCDEAEFEGELLASSPTLV
ncbi:MAG TPA: hypothetical protein VGF95_03890 [Solirubrobacteraceae bacterium]